jgi:hypothetical protein
MQLFYRYALLLFVFGIAAEGWAQGTQTTYGKNRVQYHTDFDEWSQYESDNFITYWYGEARNIGQSVVMIAEQDFHDIQGLLEHRINDKIQIIVYTDLTDLKQSNIGSEETFTNVGGQTKIAGNKVFVYFDGNHNHLRRQVREGIASVYLDAMLFGSNLQEIVQNAVMMNLPPWFKDGLAAYASEEWNSDLDNQLRDVLMNEKFENFERFAQDHPKLAGHSLWYFIAENFGKSTVSNLLYLTRINRSVESGFLYVLGSSYDAILVSWLSYYKNRYKGENAERNLPTANVKVKNRKNLPLSQLKLSPDGRKVAYVLNEIGRFSIFVQDVQTGKRERILREGFRNPFQATDYNYPLLAWNANGQEIALMFERRDVPKLLMYNIATKKLKTEDLSTQFQRVHSIDFVNPNTLVFTATVRGFSDLYLYYLNTRQSERITNDFYDDLDAVAVNVRNRRGILFASNRTDSIINPLTASAMDTILPLNTFDIFYYNLETKSRELVRVTNTPLSDERQPMPLDTTYFSYLSNRSGIVNRETGYLEDYLHHTDQVIYLKDGSEIVLHLDSTLQTLDTTQIDSIVLRPVIRERSVNRPASNYARSIVEQHTAPRADRMVELLVLHQKPQISWQPLATDTVITPLLTRFRQRQIARNLREDKLAPGRLMPTPPLPKNTPTTPPDNIFQTEPTPPDTIPVAVPVDTVQIESVPVDTLPEGSVPALQSDTSKLDIDNYFFQSEFEEREQPVKVVTQDELQPQNPAPTDTLPSQPAGNLSIVLPSELPPTTATEPALRPAYRFRPGRIVPYRLQFRTDYVTTQLDNSLLFEGLESFAAVPQQGFGYPPPGILFKANFKDLFEDYEFEGGVRIPTTFNGSEYFLTFQDKKKRLDKRFSVYRRQTRFTQENNPADDRTRVNVLLGQFGVRYPLDIFRSIRATATVRRDRATQLATYADTVRVNGQLTHYLGDATENGQRMGLKLEYVFDNTFDVALNIKNGTRYKFFMEGIKRFALDIRDGFDFSFGEGAMGIVGMDARHYQRLGKYPILALRFAGATSFGSEQNLYFLGAVDNWLFPQQEDNIPIPARDATIAFQTLATNLRGFGTNIRNGNSYAVFNSELRLPVFRMISERIKSQFLQNFQLVGFFDVGTAWFGSDPFETDNPLNTQVVKNGQFFTLKVNYFRDPIVAGYGAGVRAMLFGYFVRADYAWGIETRIVQEPRLYISLGLDF